MRSWSATGPTHASKMPARELRSVVRANRFRRSPLPHDRLQHPRHPQSGKSRVHFQRQTFPCEHVDHAQHAKLPSALRRIMHRIHGPLLVRSCQRRPHRNPLAASVFFSFAESAIPLPVFTPDTPACGSPPSLSLPASTADRRYSPLRFFPRCFHQVLAQEFIVLAAHVSAARLRHIEQLADPPLAHQKLAPQPGRTSALRSTSSYPFFSNHRFSISLSETSNPPPASSVSRFHPPAAAAAALRPHSSRHTSPSTHTRCAYSLPTPAPPPPRSSLPPSASAPRSSPLRYTSSSSCLPPLRTLGANSRKIGRSNLYADFRGDGQQ